MAPRDVRAAREAGVGEHVIEVRGLVKRYPDITAVDGIDFNVNRGEVFSLLGPDRASTFALNLSGGEKRRLGIAMALVGQPELLFLDEPTTGLDPGARRELWTLIGDLKRKGRTILLTTHYLDEAEQLADDVAILNHGKIVAHGSPSALISQFGEGTTVVLAGAGRGGYEALVARGIAAQLHGVDVLVHVPTAGQVRPMLANLASIEIPLTEIYTKRSTLEDVFLKLVGARMEEGVLAA